MRCSSVVFFFSGNGTRPAENIAITKQQVIIAGTKVITYTGTKQKLLKVSALIKIEPHRVN